MNYEVLEKGLNSLGIEYDDDILQRFGAYFDILEERGGVMNLTAITGEENVSRLHFIDCAAILKCADFKNKKVIDVGSGAGFPAIILAIAAQCANYETRFSLIESITKKTVYLNDVKEKLSLKNVDIYNKLSFI